MQCIAYEFLCNAYWDTTLKLLELQCKIYGPPGTEFIICRSFETNSLKLSAVFLESSFFILKNRKHKLDKPCAILLENITWRLPR